MINKQKIIDYVEDKHLPDGGYFFAKVEPSSGLDTYYAVKILKLLGIKTKHKNLIISFWKDTEKQGGINDLYSLFLSVETCRELQVDIGIFNKYHYLLFEIFENNRLLKKSIFTPGKSNKMEFYDNSSATLYADFLDNELKNLYYYTVLANNFKLRINAKKIIDFVLSRKNDDGGFGKISDSQLATTYFALNILNLLSYPIKSLLKTKNYLKNEWLKINYLEELYWMIEGMIMLNLSLPSSEQITLFLFDCLRDNGGFSRSRNLGIPTIEYTYYAVSILNKISCLVNKNDC